jgi:hypothetical protein
MAIDLLIGESVVVPPANRRRLFCDTDGSIKMLDPSGVESPLDLTSFKRGADLAGDATIQPFVDKVSLYVVPLLIANTTITLGNTSAPGAGQIWVCSILRTDRSAFTLTIKKADATTIYTDPVSPTWNSELQFGCNAGVWGVNLAYIAP